MDSIKSIRGILGFFDVRTFDDACRKVEKLRQQRRRPRQLLRCVPSPELNSSLDHVLDFLIGDRFVEGIGKGGWGHSDRLYMTDLYGAEAGAEMRDSVMTTVAVIQSLQAANHILRRSTTRRAKEEWPTRWERIKLDANEYTRLRYDSVIGTAGSLRMDRTGTPRLAPSYRHTGWFLQLSRCDCGHVDAVKTTQYIIEQFENVNWQEEKVATPVATISALDCVLKDENLIRLVDDKKVAFLRAAAEHELVKKYDDSLDGWKSGIHEELGRQVYTLFVLADLAHLLRDDKSVLTERMLGAYRATFQGRWRGTSGSGIPRHLVPETKEATSAEDVSLSCLAVAALIGKHLVRELSDEEKSVFEEILTALARTINRDDDWTGRAYAWAVSYFLRSVCVLLDAK